MTVDDLHLTMDELDAHLVGRLELTRQRHLEQCAECRAFAEAERELAARLASLPLFNPQAGFAERVMVSVRVPERQPAWTLAGLRHRFAAPETRGRAAAVAAALVGSMGLSVAWSLTHPDALIQAGNWLSSEGSQLLWVGLRGTASNLMEQPWYDSARDLLATPARLALVAGSSVLAYLSGMVALRRLLSVPSHRVAGASA